VTKLHHTVARIVGAALVCGALNAGAAALGSSLGHYSVDPTARTYRSHSLGRPNRHRSAERDQRRIGAALVCGALNAGAAVLGTILGSSLGHYSGDPTARTYRSKNLGCPNRHRSVERDQRTFLSMGGGVALATARPARCCHDSVGPSKRY
jgi:hypothetical protein